MNKVSTERTVHDQEELDAALAEKVWRIYIDSPSGVWLILRDNGSSSVEARGSSSVEARGSSSVEAWGSSSVVAWGSSSVVAWDSSSVVARDSSSVEARGSSSVVAWDSSSVVARGSSSVVARDSSSVEARGSSSVEARGAATLHAWRLKKATAGPRCAVYLHNAGLNIDGGVVIDVTKPDKTASDWCDWNGVEVIDDRAIVYKAVDDNFTTSRGFVYEPGAHLTAPDWRDDNTCGGGLHFGPTPHHAREYFHDATRFIKVSIPIGAAHPIPGGTAKIKARECLVLGEVTIDRKPIEVAADA